MNDQDVTSSGSDQRDAMTGSAILCLVCFQVCFEAGKLVQVSCMLSFQQRGRSQNDVSTLVLVLGRRKRESGACVGRF